MLHAFGRPIALVAFAVAVLVLLAVNMPGQAQAIPSDGVTISVDGAPAKDIPADGRIHDVGRGSDGVCGEVPSFELFLSDDAHIAEVTFDHDDCTLKLTSVQHDTSPTFDERARSSSGSTRFTMRTSATTRGFAYVEQLNRTRVNISAYTVPLNQSGPISSANNAWHDCYAWSTTGWRTNWCRKDGENLTSKWSVWIKATGDYTWQQGSFYKNQQTWAKARIRGYKTGTGRFVSTCGSQGGFPRPINYFRCERWWQQA